MVVLLSLVMVAALGTWIPLVQTVSGVPQRTRTLYITAGNVLFAGVALAVTGGQLAWGWRGFWLPAVGGVVWTAGNYCAFRASESIGLARAAGSWTPLNIIVAFAWGAAAFGELDGFSGTQLALLGGALVLVVGGVLVIVRSQDAPSQAVSPEAGPRQHGLMWAAAAGVLWGSYFVPAQWAGTSAQVSNFPLAVGMLAGGVALVLPGGAPVRLRATAVTPLLAAGMVFGIGNLALLGLVARVGTGVGFTIAQLSLLVNASIGIWLFKMPAPGSRAAKLTVAGILIAGSGGAIIGAMR
jgi:glucose uptake protein GlcU